MKHPSKNIILIYVFLLLFIHPSSCSFQFTYGVNAWRHWVVGKNAELEKARSQGKYIKPFETDILKLRADELNYTLCMFVKEVKKPNGEPYASDSIFYLTLGIQVCKLLIFVTMMIKIGIQKKESNPPLSQYGGFLLKRLRLRYRNSTLVSVPDTEFRSHTTIDLVQ